MENEVELMLIAFTAALIVLVTMLILLMVFVQRRKIKFLLKREGDKMLFEKELQRSRMEITEENFKYVSRELHDNIGQLLSVASIQIKQAKINSDGQQLHDLESTEEIISDALTDIRALSMNLNSGMINELGLVKSIQKEVNRIERLGQYSIRFKHPVEELTLDKDHELIMFRILQEFLSNSLKHSQAETIIINLLVENQMLTLSGSDNGKGFNPLDNKLGSGMRNMRERAKLINAIFEISSTLNEGSKFSLKYNMH